MQIVLEINNHGVLSSTNNRIHAFYRFNASGGECARGKLYVLASFSGMDSLNKLSFYPSLRNATLFPECGRHVAAVKLRVSRYGSGAIIC